MTQKRKEKKRKSREEACRTGLGTVGRVGDEAGEGKVLVAGNGKVLDGEVEHVLLGAPLGLVGHLVEGLRDVESQVDEHAVSRSLDFVVPEENVGLEETDGLIDDVGLVCAWRRADAGQYEVDERKRRMDRNPPTRTSRAVVAGGGTLVLGLDGEEGHATHDAHVGLLVVLRVVGLTKVITHRERWSTKKNEATTSWGEGLKKRIKTIKRD